jgi:hypothetical protein
LIMGFIGLSLIAKAQTNPFPTTDSLERFINRWIRNSPVEAFQNLRLNTSLIGMLRFIQNSEIGAGLDTAYKFNDSTIRLITFAPDTFDVTLRFSGGGTANGNVGLGFRILKPGTQELKTLFSSNTIIIDSSSNTDGLTPKVDTSVIATQYDLTQATGLSDTTRVEGPIKVKTGVSGDTLYFDYDWGLTIDADSSQIADSLEVVSWERLNKVADSLIALMATAGVPNANIAAGYRWLIPGTQEIKTVSNSSTVTWDSTSTANTLTATVPDNAITNAKLAQAAALTVKGNPTNATANVQDIAAATDNTVFRRSGTTLGFGAVNLASSNAVTGELVNTNIAAFSPFPAQRTYGKIYEKNFWNNNAEDLQVGSTGSNTIAVSAGQIQLSAGTFNGAHIVNIIPGRISALNKSKITAQFQLNNLSATTHELGLKINSVITHSGAQFGYMGFVQTTSSGTGSLFLYDQARGSSKATAVPGFTFATNDNIELVLDLRDTILVFTAQNLTTDPTGASKKTISYSFLPNSSAHILPNSYNWTVYDGNGGSGVRTLKYVKIESDDIQYPNLLILGNSKTKIGYATFWNGRFGMQLNATYPSVVINAGGAERLSDMILRLDEILAISPSQVLLADIASNSIRAGIPIATVVYEYRYIVSRLEGAGIRVLHLILPEDSTAGGLGQTAWHARLSAEYPSTYMAAVYNDMSTNNIADAGMIHADGIHLVQAGNNQVTASVISTGMVQTISAQRRSEIRTNDRWIVKTGDSLHFARKIFSRHNYVPRWDDNNQSLTVGIQMMDSTQFAFSASSRPTKPLASLLGWVEGAFGISGNQGGEYLFGRDNSAQYYARYVNLNTMYTNVAGVDVKYAGSDGRESWGNQASVSSAIIPSTINIKRSTTFTQLFARKGFSLSSDSTTFTYSGTGALGDRSINSFHKARMIATGSTSYDTLATVHIEGAPYTVGGDNVTINFPLALEVLFGKTHLGGGVSILNSPTGYGAYRIAVINPDSTLGTITAGALGGITSINGETGAAQTLTATNGLTRTTTTNNVEYKLGGTLTENTTILGGTRQLSLGTAGDKLGATSIVASSASVISDNRLNLFGGITYLAVQHTADANLSMNISTGVLELATGSLTTDRTITLPPAQVHGQVLTIVVRFASSGSHYVLSAAVEDIKTGSTFTQLDWGTTYDFMVNASIGWMLIRKY